MELYIQTFITVLSLMNPVMCGLIFKVTVQSFMGLIVMAMGMQLALKGLSTYFHLAGS